MTEDIGLGKLKIQQRKNPKKNLLSLKRDKQPVNFPSTICHQNCKKTTRPELQKVNSFTQSQTVKINFTRKKRVNREGFGISIEQD